MDPLTITVDSSKPREQLSLEKLSSKNLTAFLSPETLETVKQVLKGDSTDPAAPLSPTKLRWMWKTLLIEAIHFLRINDCRERAFLRDRDQPWSQANKTHMGDEGAADAARLNAYGIEALSKYFERFNDFESTLYGVDRHYRDHIEHPVHVWLLGMHVLDRYGSEFSFRSSAAVKVMDSEAADPAWDCFVQQKKRCKVEDCEDCSENSGCQNLLISTAELGAMWTIVALTHDLGYPLEKVERINDKLEEMLNEFGNIAFARSTFQFTSQHDHLVQALLKIIGSTAEYVGKGRWQTRLRSKYHSKFARSWEDFDHGIVSSLILLRALTFFLETDITQDTRKPLDGEDARQFVVRSEILHAIAAHTAPKVYHLRANTLPFLLVLCDDLQEWGRPTMADIKAGDLTGSAKQVTLKIVIEGEKSEIECKIVHNEDWDLDAQKRHARHVFKVWHERLRPALDDCDRKMKLVWKISFGPDTKPWMLTIDSQQRVFEIVKAKAPSKDGLHQDPFDLYEDAR